MLCLYVSGSISWIDYKHFHKSMDSYYSIVVIGMQSDRGAIVAPDSRSHSRTPAREQGGRVRRRPTTGPATRDSRFTIHP